MINTLNEETFDVLIKQQVTSQQLYCSLEVSTTSAFFATTITTTYKIHHKEMEVNQRFVWQLSPVQFTLLPSSCNDSSMTPT